MLWDKVCFPSHLLCSDESRTRQIWWFPQSYTDFINFWNKTSKTHCNSAVLQSFSYNLYIYCFWVTLIHLSPKSVYLKALLYLDTELCSLQPTSLIRLVKMIFVSCYNQSSDSMIVQKIVIPSRSVAFYPLSEFSWKQSDSVKNQYCEWYFYIVRIFIRHSVF